MHVAPLPPPLVEGVLFEPFCPADNTFTAAAAAVAGRHALYVITHPDGAHRAAGKVRAPFIVCVLGGGSICHGCVLLPGCPTAFVCVCAC